MKKYYLKDYDGTYLMGVMGEGWTLEESNAGKFGYFSALFWKFYLNIGGLYLEIV